MSLQPCPTLPSQFSLFSQLGPRPLPKSNAQEAETQLLAVDKTSGCYNSLCTIPRAPKSYKSPACFLGEPLVNASNSAFVSVSLASLCSDSKLYLLTLSHHDFQLDQSCSLPLTPCDFQGRSRIGPVVNMAALHSGFLLR